jgi:hypothetical protein
MPGAEPVKLAEPDGGKDLAALGARSEGPPEDAEPRKPAGSCLPGVEPDADRRSHPFGHS